MSLPPKKIVEDYQKELSLNLKYLLDIYSMNMLELSKKIKISYGSIYDLVECNSNPTLTTLFKIAGYFDLTISQLIGDLPITTNSNPNFIKTVPILELSEVLGFLDNSPSDFNKYQHKLISISSKNEFQEKTFALIANEKTEPAFTRGTFLIFDKLTMELEKYDNRFVLILNSSSSLSFKKLVVEGDDIFLQSFNTNVPLQRLNDDLKIIACLVQAKLDLGN